MNTILLKGRGKATVDLFSLFSANYEHVSWKSSAKWWQFETRHELRIQNLSPDEIQEIKEALDDYWLEPISMHVF